MKYNDVNELIETFPVGSFITISFYRSLSYNTPDRIIAKVREFFIGSDNHIKVRAEYGLNGDGELKINSTFGILSTSEVRLATDAEIKILQKKYLMCDDAIKNITDNISNLTSEQKKVFLHYLIDKMF